MSDQILDKVVEKTEERLHRIVHRCNEYLDGVEQVSRIKAEAEATLALLQEARPLPLLEDDEDE